MKLNCVHCIVSRMRSRYTQNKIYQLIGSHRIIVQLSELFIILLAEFSCKQMKSSDSSKNLITSFSVARFTSFYLSLSLFFLYLSFANEFRLNFPMYLTALHNVLSNNLDQQKVVQLALSFFSSLPSSLSLSLFLHTVEILAFSRATETKIEGEHFCL